MEKILKGSHHSGKIQIISRKVCLRWTGHYVIQPAIDSLAIWPGNSSRSNFENMKINVSIFLSIFVDTHYVCSVKIFAHTIRQCGLLHKPPCGYAIFFMLHPRLFEDLWRSQFPNALGCIMAGSDREHSWVYLKNLFIST